MFLWFASSSSSLSTPRLSSSLSRWVASFLSRFTCIARRRLALEFGSAFSSGTRTAFSESHAVATFLTAFFSKQKKIVAASSKHFSFVFSLSIVVTRQFAVRRTEHKPKWWKSVDEDKRNEMHNEHWIRTERAQDANYVVMHVKHSTSDIGRKSKLRKSEASVIWHWRWRRSRIHQTKVFGLSTGRQRKKKGVQVNDRKWNATRRLCRIVYRAFIVPLICSVT